MDIKNDKELILDLARQISSTICILDIIKKKNELENSNIDFKTQDSIILPIKKEWFNQIDIFEYIELLKTIITNMRIPSENLDIFHSFISSSELEKFLRDYDDHLKYIDVQVRNEGLLIVLPVITSDILLLPIGRFHWEVYKTIEHFYKVKQLGVNIFLNSKSSNRVSQFINKFVAGQLGIPSTTQFELGVK